MTPHVTTGTHVAAPTPTAPATLVKDGVTLLADAGNAGTIQADLTFSYQFFQCSTPPTGCTAVGTAERLAELPPAADRCRVRDGGRRHRHRERRVDLGDE